MTAGVAAALALPLASGVALAAFSLPSPLAEEGRVGALLAACVVVVVCATVFAVRERRSGRRARADARREAAVLRELGVGVMTLDRHARVTGANEFLLAQVGLPASSIVGRGWDAPLWAWSSPSEFEAARAAAMDGTASSFAWTLRRADGERFVAQVALAALPDDGFVATVIGAAWGEAQLGGSQHGAVVAGLATARAEAAAAAAVPETTLMALVSREMRTPLTSVMGYLSDVQDMLPGEEDDEVLELLGAATRNAGRLEQLVDDLMTLGDVGGPDAPPHTDLDLAELASEACAAAAAGARRLGVEFILLIDGSSPVRGDRAGLSRVISNLILNALRFTPAGGRAEVSVGADADVSLVEIADNGLDLAEEDLADLFEPERVGPVSSRASMAAGFRMTVVKRVIDAHGGDVTVRRGPNGGATFRISLPRADPAPTVSPG